ncbi:tetratricopeptide repeat protein [Kaarinaea lacus]
MLSRNRILNIKRQHVVQTIRLIPLGFFLLVAVVPMVQAVVPQRMLGDMQPIGETIASFDKYINSGRLQGAALAQRYWERGIQYGKLGHYDKAVSDYTSAIKINPQLIDAYIDRAIGFARLEKYSEAYADLNTVLQIQSNNLRAYVTRGSLNFLVGKYQNAAADFKRYLQLNPNDIYRMLWLFLSEKYNNRDAVSDVPKFSSKVNLDEWPGAILKLYLGEVEAEGIIEALSKGVPNMQIGHACEAYYYLAQYFLLQNDRQKALELFNKAVATQAKSYVEYEFALAYSIKLRQK